MLVFFSPTESQKVNITSQLPPNPVRVLEEQPLTLEWTFEVLTTLLRVELAVSGIRVALVEASPGSSDIRGIFIGRATATSTETNATIEFTSMRRGDTARYEFAVIDKNGLFDAVPLELIVQCKYKITSIFKVY